MTMVSGQCHLWRVRHHKMYSSFDLSIVFLSSLLLFPSHPVFLRLLHHVFFEGVNKAYDGRQWYLLKTQAIQDSIAASLSSTQQPKPPTINITYRC